MAQMAVLYGMALIFLTKRTPVSAACAPRGSRVLSSRVVPQKSWDEAEHEESRSSLMSTEGVFERLMPEEAMCFAGLRF